MSLRGTFKWIVRLAYFLLAKITDCWLKQFMIYICEYTYYKYTYLLLITRQQT